LLIFTALAASLAAGSLRGPGAAVFFTAQAVFVMFNNAKNTN
jgi:hypothetical protein